MILISRLAANVADYIVGAEKREEIRYIKIQNVNTYSSWIFEKIEKATFNNYYPGYFEGQGSSIYIKITLNTTGSQSIWLNNVLYLSFFNEYGKWNNISSNIHILGPYDSIPTGVTPFQVELRGYTPSDPEEIDSECGYAQLRYNDTNHFLWENATDAIIYMNTNAAGALAGATVTRQSEVFLHELGHVLKLAHPKAHDHLMTVVNGRGGYGDGEHDDIVVALMNQKNSWNSTNLASRYPKWHDKINLKNKWGS